MFIDLFPSLPTSHVMWPSTMGSSNSTAAGSTPLLPRECLLLILRQCEGSTLKNARLASKSFASIAEPLLWRNLRLVPNADCISSVNQLIRQSRIAYHVQNVIYDAAWEYLIDDFRIKCEKPEIRDRPCSTPGKGHLSCGKILKQAVENQIRAGEDGTIELAYLNKVLKVLPNLREITVKESFSTYESSSCMPHYYQQVSKESGLPLSDIRTAGAFAPVDTNHSHTRNFIHAAFSTERDFDAIDLRAISWHTFFRSSIDASQPQVHDFRIRKELFSKVKQLDLSFRGHPSRDYEVNLKPLRELLKSCEKLENLYLSFTNIINNRRYTNDNRSFSYIAGLLGDHRSVRPLIPRLRDLFLSSVFCTQQDLIHFLAIHAATLRHVSLSNVSLLRNETKDARGCWVQVFKGMKSLLHLESVYFSGWLSNGGRQVWHVSEDASDNSRLRPAVIKFITDSSVKDCPLDHVAIAGDHEDVEKPPSGWAEGDWTWTMTYTSSKTRGEQTHSGSELFTKDVPLDSDDWAIANPHFWKSPYKHSYPSCPEPYPSKKTSPNSSTWSWTDHDSIASWPAPIKKGKQKVPSTSSSAWDWTQPPSAIDPFYFGVASESWDAPPGIESQQSTDLSKVGDTSPQSSSSSHESVSQGTSSSPNAESLFPEDVIVDFPDFGTPPPPPVPQSTHKFPKPPHTLGSQIWSYDGNPPGLNGGFGSSSGWPSSTDPHYYSKPTSKYSHGGFSSNWYSTHDTLSNSKSGPSGIVNSVSSTSMKSPPPYGGGMTFASAMAQAAQQHEKEAQAQSASKSSGLLPFGYQISYPEASISSNKNDSHDLGLAKWEIPKKTGIQKIQNW